MYVTDRSPCITSMPDPADVAPLESTEQRIERPVLARERDRHSPAFGCMHMDRGHDSVLSTRLQDLRGSAYAQVNSLVQQL